MIGERTAIGVRQALLKHYLGASLSKAFEQTRSVSRATHYRLKKECPEEIGRIEGEARKEALEGLNDNMLSLRCAMTTYSVEIQGVRQRCSSPIYRSLRASYRVSLRS
jgi:hypothetical protein